MVINDLNIVGARIWPPEHNTPLIVDTNAMETCKISSQQFQPVPRRRFQIIQRLCCIENIQLVQCYLFDLIRYSPRSTTRNAVKKIRRRATSKRNYHLFRLMYSRMPCRRVFARNASNNQHFVVVFLLAHFYS